METQEFFKFYVIVTGVKKRCRKAERHMLKAGYFPYNEGSFDRDVVESIARGLIETNIKQVTGKVFISLDHVVRDEHFERWEMFSDKHVKFELKTPLENELN